MMMLSEIYQCLGLSFPEDDIQCHGVSTDTRTLKPGDIFIALNGPNYHGSDFVEQAFNKGAIAAVVDKKIASLTQHQLVYPEPLVALGKIASLWRDKFSIPVVGITGSCGKTSVKEMVYAVLSQKFKTLATEANHNNEIGVPLTLFKLTNDHECAVIEMGASKKGDIEYLCSIAKPSVGVVTNAGSAHLEGFKDIFGVAETKGELFRCLPQSGVAVINHNDTFCHFWQSTNNAAKVIRFGGSDEAEVYCKDVEIKGDGTSVFTLVTQKGYVNIELKFPGKHNVDNAIAAAAIGLSLDLTLKQIQTGLESAVPIAGRLKMYSGKQGGLIIDDCYNANPSSVKAAIEFLVRRKGEKVLVLGDMAELGNSAEALHRKIGEDAYRMGVSQVLTVGSDSRFVSDAFNDNGKHFDSKEQLVDFLTPRLNSEVTVLVKGSRSSQMEMIVDSIKANERDD